MSNRCEIVVFNYDRSGLIQGARTIYPSRNFKPTGHGELKPKILHFFRLDFYPSLFVFNYFLDNDGVSRALIDLFWKIPNKMDPSSSEIKMKKVFQRGDDE